MYDIGIVNFLVILTTVIISYMGLTSQPFFDKYLFSIEYILVKKEYKRIGTSGFLHVSWTHLLINMLSLYFFGGFIELFLGAQQFLIIYFSSLIGGNLFSLYIHRNNGNYSSAGASGAVCGTVFAAIALIPGIGINIMLVPISIPGWLYGLLFTVYSMYGIQSKRGHVGHEAHLGGAIVGMAIAILYRPSSIIVNTLPILIIIAPCIIFIVIIVLRPDLLFIDRLLFKKNKHFTIEDKYNSEKIEEQYIVDKILEKIHAKGLSSLSKKEKETLDNFSKK